MCSPSVGLRELRLHLGTEWPEAWLLWKPLLRYLVWWLFFFFPCLTLFFLRDNLVSIMAWYQNTLFETDVWVGKDWFKETMS